MKRAATISLAMTLITLSAGIFKPAMAEGLLTDLVKDTLGTAVGVTGAVVGGSTGITAGAVSGAANIVTGTVDATGNVIDASGRVIGTIVPGSFDATVSTAGSSRVIMGTTTNVLSTNIDLRIADMRRLVAQNQFNGKLTPAQASELTTSLDRISNTLATERVAGRTLTFDEAVALARDLDAANVRLGQFVGKAPFSPMVVMQQGSPGLMIITKGGVISSADVPAVTTGVPTTVATATPTIATAVPTVATGLPGVTTSPATMWPNVVPATAVVTSTNGIPTNVVAVMPIIDARRMELDRSIANAVANRTVNISEAARLSTDLNNLGMKIAAAQASGANFGMDQTIALARSLDDFNVRLATAISAAPLVPLTVTNASGLPALSTATFSNVVGLPAVEPNVWFTTLTTRRGELEQMIATGAGTSTLTGTQAQELRNELTRINELIEGARTAGTITYTTALPIAMNLDVLGNRIHTYVTSVPFTPLISGGRITFAGGLVSPIDELSLRRAELGAAIDRERALGRLSVQEAQRLQFQLGAIADREGRFRHDGLFTYRELTIINDDLNRLTGRVNSMVANRRTTVSVR